MLDIIFFIWIGLKTDMPPVWFVLCGVYIVAWLLKKAIDGTKND
jgi:hypothetical protein